MVLVTILLIVEEFVESVLELSVIYGYEIEEAYFVQWWKGLITSQKRGFMRVRSNLDL